MYISVLLMISDGTVVIRQENMTVKTCTVRTMTSTGQPLRAVQIKSSDGSHCHSEASLQRCRRYWEVTTAQQ